MLVFLWCGFYWTKDAYYMLSALVQSEAAIVGIVITLSLIAIQFTASSYSPRVIKIFKRALDLWILTSLYISAIISDLATPKIVDESQITDFESCIALSYFLGNFLLRIAHSIHL
jgi:uncharacterized membrane protein